MKHALVMALLLSSPLALADTAPEPKIPDNNNAQITNSGAGYKGNLTVNQAAGNQQQQTNNRAIAIGTQAQASTPITQQLSGKADASPNASVSILGNSFSNGTGMIGVNQSAGARNQMVNAVRIGISALPQSMDDSALSQQNVVLIPNSGAVDTPSGSRQVVTSDQAFTGSRGVVQVNQSAGVGNRMANTLNIRVAD